MKYFLVSFLSVIVFSSLSFAASLPALEREVSVRAQNEQVKEVLTLMAQQAGIQFSYNPAKVAVTTKVSLSLLKKPVRLVLNILFKNAVQYKQKGNYIILIAAPVPAANVPVKKIIVSGYIHDTRGYKLIDASVFDKKNQLSAVTNVYGFFSLQIPANTLPIEVRVLKENYLDTSVIIHTFENTIDIILQRQPEKIIQVTLPITEEKKAEEKPESMDSLPMEQTDTTLPAVSGKKKFLEQWVSPRIKANLHNISDTLFTRVQFSFVPYLSTNQLLSGNTVNDFSFNVLGGYSQGINKAEFGALINIDRGDVKYFQAAGLMNLVGGNVKGGQFAGLINLNRQTISGTQGAGLMNINIGKVAGVQAAGLINFTDTINGVQAGGLVNVCRYFRGVQASGLVNACIKADGVQAASLVNTALTVNGWQCASLVNAAGYVKGGQVALINVVDSCNGIPVGFLSYVHHGYHKLEIAGDEVLYAQLAFRTGVLSFHNIFSLGVNPFVNGTTIAGVGYGLGSYTHISKKWNFGGDIYAQSLVKDFNFKNAPLLTSVFVGFEAKATQKFSIVFGPAFRALFTYTQSTDYLAVNNQLAPYAFTNHSFNNGTNVKLWVGGKIGFRFL